MNLTHFQSMILFALAISFAFAFLSKHDMRDRLRYALWAFAAFMAVAIGIGWLMYPFSH
jgi:multidrug transporter EmrE-like cation transporter